MKSHKNINLMWNWQQNLFRFHQHPQFFAAIQLQVSETIIFNWCSSNKTTAGQFYYLHKQEQDNFVISISSSAGRTSNWPVRAAAQMIFCAATGSVSKYDPFLFNLVVDFSLISNLMTCLKLTEMLVFLTFIFSVIAFTPTEKVVCVRV